MWRHSPCRSVPLKALINPIMQDLRTIHVHIHSYTAIHGTREHRTSQAHCSLYGGERILSITALPRAQPLRIRSLLAQRHRSVRSPARQHTRMLNHLARCPSMRRTCKTHASHIERARAVASPVSLQTGRGFGVTLPASPDAFLCHRH